jgi:hypothetical protein
VGTFDTAVRKLERDDKRSGVSQPPEAEPIPASAGRAPNSIPKAGGGGDLKEPNYAARTYHPRRTMRSTDSLITWEYDPIKSVEMVDSTGARVVLTFAEPTT